MFQKTDPVETLVGAGKSIIQALHDRYERDRLDDAEHIPTVKAAITGMKDYLRYLDPGSVAPIGLEEVLKSHARKLYIEVWLAYEEKPEDEDPVVATENATYYFDYIYEHGEHPDY